MNGRRLVRLAMIFVLSLGGALFSNAAPTYANGNNNLNLSFNTTLNGDVTAAGVGLRGTGAGEISLTSIPDGAAVSRAFLYWATLGSANTFTSPVLEGVEVDGDLIGTSGDTCWGVDNNFVYRADVTSLVSGNGEYSISGLPDNLAGGNDSQGASLVVVYEDDSLPMRTVVVNDGAVSLNFSQMTYSHTITGFTPDDPVTDADVIYLVGDGQAMWDAANINFNGETIAAGVFSGADGDFWGTHTFDVTGLVTSAPANTMINNNDPDNPDSPDCLLWTATIFSVTTGDTGVVQNNLTQSYNQSLFGNVTAAGVGLRGTGAGSIFLSSIPSGATVDQAFLYWATIGNSSQFTSPQMQGITIKGDLIGISADTCWGAQANFVYRADVTGLVQANGSYSISGLPSNLATGNDTQGASLVVVYRSAGLYRSVIINDGAVTLDLDNHEYTDTLEGFSADQPLAQAKVTYLIGDGQARWDNGNVAFEGTSIANNVFTGVDGDHWGTLTFDVTGLVTEPEATTTINNNDPDNPTTPDCLVWAATVFAVETEPPAQRDANGLYFPLVFKTGTVTGEEPALDISPETGSPGTAVTVSGSGFPADTILAIGPAPSGSEPTDLDEVTTDEDGSFTTEVTIPQTAQIGSTWVVQASTIDGSASAISESFLVVAAFDE